MSVRAAMILLAALAAALIGAAPAAALTAAEMYETDTVVVIDLGLSPQSEAALEAEPDEYVEGTFALAETDGTPAGTGDFSAPLTVGIRLKGEASFRGLDGKAAFKVKFNEFVKGQKFLGLKSLTLNNMVQDPSMAHEALAYEVFRAAGVAAPRSGYADVRLNGEEFGLHLNLETLDDVALERIFGSFDDPQHLYEGAYEVDVVPGAAGEFEVDEGDEDDRADLEALIAAVAAATPSFSERVAAVADLEQMTRMWAVERYLGHWDGYAGLHPPHNYYLYSDPAGVFQMLPWGTDQTWTAPHIGFDDLGPVLFEACLADDPCRALYRAALVEVEALVGELGPGAEAIRLGALLAPWQALEVAPRKPFGPSEVAAAVAGVGQFAALRPVVLAKWLAGEEPQDEVPETPVPPGDDEVEAVVPDDTKSAPVVVSAAPTLPARLPVDRAKLGSGLLLTWFEAPAPGAVYLAASIVTADGPVTACAASRTAAEPGPLALDCRLAPRVRRHLAARWLRLRLQLTVEHPGQPPASLQRTIRLPRTAR